MLNAIGQQLEVYAYKCSVCPTTTRAVLSSEKDEQYCDRTHLGELPSPMRRLRLIGGTL